MFHAHQKVAHARRRRRACGERKPQRRRHRSPAAARLAADRGVPFLVPLRGAGREEGARRWLDAVRTQPTLHQSHLRSGAPRRGAHRGDLRRFVVDEDDVRAGLADGPSRSTRACATRCARLAREDGTFRLPARRPGSSTFPATRRRRGRGVRSRGVGARRRSTASCAPSERVDTARAAARRARAGSRSARLRRLARSMKVVMTLLARDEADIVDSWLEFHLNAGADFVIATDNRSGDGTTEILERYAREGHVHLIREPGEDLRQDEWVTRMARLAATEFGADWVINSDADEFWWPRGASLSRRARRGADRYGTVVGVPACLLPRPGDEPFAERMTVRFSPLAPINDPASLYKPIRKVDPPGASRDPAHAREPRPRRQPVRPAPGMVSDRVLPLPAAVGGAVRAQGVAAGRSICEAHRPAADRVPRRHVLGAHERPDRRVLRVARGRRHGARSRGGAGRLVVDTRLRDALRQLRDRRARATPPGEHARARFPAPDARRGRRVRGRGGRAR